MVNKNMVSKKTLLLTSGILGLFIMVAGIQGIVASPASLPSYLSTGTTIKGYKLVYYNNITVNNFENTKVNVTCWTTIWFKNESNSARIIGASLVNEGGKILDKALNLTKTDTKTLAARTLLAAAGLTSAQMDSITNVWDLVIDLLLLKNGSSYVLTQPTISKADHAVLLNITGHPYFKHALFASKGAYMLLALDYAVENWSVADWTNSTLIKDALEAKFQIDVWFFWGLFGTILKFFSEAADWLSSSSVPASSTSAESNKIAASANTPSSDMESFAAGWADLFGGSSIPGFEPSLVIAMAATTVVIIGFKVKKSRKSL
jgi:hypothetical protein